MAEQVPGKIVATSAEARTGAGEYLHSLTGEKAPCSASGACNETAAQTAGKPLRALHNPAWSPPKEETAADAFVADLLAALPASARPAALSVLERWRGETVYLNRRLMDAARVDLALTMIRAGLSSSQIRIRLAQRYQVSPTTAGRIYRAALAESAKPQAFCTSRLSAFGHTLPDTERTK